MILPLTEQDGYLGRGDSEGSCWIAKRCQPISHEFTHEGLTAENKGESKGHCDRTQDQPKGQIDNIGGNAHLLEGHGRH